MKPIEQRFWTKVEKTEGCWLWSGATNKQGYGELGKGRRGDGNIAAHRLSYEIAYGPIPPAMQVLHKCDNPGCVRPDHLFLGTQKVNLEDMTAKDHRSHYSQKGEDNGRAKLTLIQVQEIRQRFANGDLRSLLAKEYRVRWRVIDRIVTGKSWRV